MNYEIRRDIDGMKKQKEKGRKKVKKKNEQ